MRSSNLVYPGPNTLQKYLSICLWPLPLLSGGRQAPGNARKTLWLPPKTNIPILSINDMWFKAISDLNVEYSVDGDGRRMWVRPVCGGAVWRKQIVSIAPRPALLSLLTSVKQTQSDCSPPTSLPPETTTTVLERNSLKLHKSWSKTSEIGF